MNQSIVLESRSTSASTMLYFWASVLKSGPDKHGEKNWTSEWFPLWSSATATWTAKQPWCARTRTNRNNLTMLINFSNITSVSVSCCAFWTKGQTTASAHWSRKRTWNIVRTSKQMPRATQKSQRMSLMCGCGFFQSCLIARPCLVMTCRDLCDLEKPRTETVLVHKQRECALTAADGEPMPHIRFDVKSPNTSEEKSKSHNTTNQSRCSRGCTAAL